MRVHTSEVVVMTLSSLGTHSQMNQEFTFLMRFVVSLVNVRILKMADIFACIRLVSVWKTHSI